MKISRRPVAFVVTRGTHLPGEEGEHFPGPPVDVIDDGKSWRLVFEIAGADPSRISLQIEGRLVTLRGERPPTDPRTGQFLRIERVAGPFERRIELPEVPDPERTHASYVDGLLVVDIPRHHLAAGRNIPVRRAEPEKTK
jgi:HSP20 family protein